MKSASQHPRVVALALALALLASPQRAVAQSQCRDAYQEGQRLHRAKKLLQARADFQVCAHSPCPKAFQPECRAWLEEVEAELPTVVISSRGGSVGANPRVTVDGVLFQTALDGLARPLDPGLHELVLEAEDQRVVVQRSVTSGVQAQSIVFEVPRPPAPAPPPSAPAPQPTRARVSAATWALSGLAVVAFGTSAVFGVKGLGARGDLADCRPGCLPGQITDVRRDFLASDIASGIGIVALAAAVVVFVVGLPPSPRPSQVTPPR